MAEKKEHAAPESAEESLNRLMEMLSVSGAFKVYRTEPKPQSFMFESFTPPKQWSVNGITLFRYGTNVCIGDSKTKVHAWDHVEIVKKIKSLLKKGYRQEEKQTQKSDTKTVKFHHFQMMLAGICKI